MSAGDGPAAPPAQVAPGPLETKAPAAIQGRFQYSLGGLFQTFFLVSLMVGIYGGMLRSAARRDPFATVVYLGLSLTMPIAVMMLGSALLQFRQWRLKRVSAGDRR